MVKGKLARGLFASPVDRTSQNFRERLAAVIAATAAEVFHGGRPSI
jgi:hypothetical protein